MPYSALGYKTETPEQQVKINWLLMQQSWVSAANKKETLGNDSMAKASKLLTFISLFTYEKTLKIYNYLFNKDFKQKSIWSDAKNTLKPVELSCELDTARILSSEMFCLSVLCWGSSEYSSVRFTVDMTIMLWSFSSWTPIDLYAHWLQRQHAHLINK